MRRPVHRFAVLIDNPVVSEGGVHPSASLMLKGGISHAQAAFTEAAVMLLALDHHRYPALVFPPSCRRVLAHFPSVRVDAHGTVKNGRVAKRLLWVFAGARDRTAADHGFSWYHLDRKSVV